MNNRNIFPNMRQRRNLAKWTDLELQQYINKIAHYWTVLEGELFLRGNGDRPYNENGTKRK